VTESASGAILVYAGGVSNGKLYEMNDGTDDDGSDIYFEVIDRPRTGGSADSEKLWKDGGFYCSGSGADYDIEVSSIYDLSGAEEDVKQISLASGGDLWDNSNWDTAEFGGEESKRRKYQTHRKAFHRQLVFRQTESAAPITLFSWINSGSLFRLY
jgi:hypothetical protein